MKRINGIRQLKKHLRSSFNGTHSFTVIAYTDNFYDGRKGVFVDRSERYYLHGGFKSKTVNVSSRRREIIADSFIDETYRLFNFPDRVIKRLSETK